MDPSAVVIGGASGIGAAVAQRYRALDVPVMVWDVDPRADVVCDVGDDAAVTAAVAATIGRVGVPTWVTVTAGVGHAGMLLDATADEWDRTMRVNARGPWLVMRALAQAMIDAGAGGSIVATSSISARLADRGMGLYCASKAALSMIVAVAAAEWASHDIRVNAVGPGVTHTPMLGPAPTDSGWLAAVGRRTPLGRLGGAEDIADAVIALHGLGWVTGQVLECDGGLSLVSPIDPFGHPDRP